MFAIALRIGVTALVQDTTGRHHVVVCEHFVKFGCKDAQHLNGKRSI